VNPYVLLTNGHDGTRALRMIPTSVRVVCNNTLNLAMGRSTKGGGFTLHHSKNLQARVEDARSKLGIIVERVDTFQEEIQALARHSLKETEVTDYFHKLFPVKSKKPAAIDTGRILDQILDATAAKRDLVDELLAGNVAEQSRAEKRNEAILEQIMVNFHNSTNTMPGVEGSAWAAYNAVSEWADHQKAVRGKSEWDKADNRLNSIWFGSANQVKQEAYQNALALVR
jgi:phage/plasmid-like protein (TIGR03299 family)